MLYVWYYFYVDASFDTMASKIKFLALPSNVSNKWSYMYIEIEKDPSVVRVAIISTYFTNYSSWSPWSICQDAFFSWLYCFEWLKQYCFCKVLLIVWHFFRVRQHGNQTFKPLPLHIVFSNFCCFFVSILITKVLFWTFEILRKMKL